MNKQQVRRLYKDYRKSFDNEDFNRALEQNRRLYREIHRNYIKAKNGSKEIFIRGLDGLEEEATLISHNIQIKSEEVK
jgi:hypothetical protein